MQQEKNIYDQLSAINPIQASYTVLFEDSDEENDPKDSSGAPSTANTANLTVSAQGSNTALNTKNDTNALVTRNSSTVANAESDCNTSDTHLSKTDAKNYIQSKDYRKRKCVSETDTTNCSKRKKKRKDRDNAENDSNKTIEKQSIHQEKEKGESEKLVTVDLQTINNTTLQNSQNTDPTILECYKHLLKTVSEHLCEIIHTYDSNAKEVIEKHLPGTAESQKSWSRCLRKKQVFFNMSYCIVLNVIIPQKHNKRFLDDFISDSCNLMQAKGRTCTNSQMNQLVTEMIAWTERKSSLKQTSENNDKDLNLNETQSNPIQTPAITISDDEEVVEQKPITILTLNKEENRIKKDNENSQSDQIEDISSNLPENYIIDEKDPLAISEIDEKNLVNSSVFNEKVSLVNTTIAEIDQLLNEQHIRTSKKLETLSANHQAYSMLLDKESAQIEKLIAQNNLICDINEVIMNNGTIPPTPQVPMQDNSKTPSNLVPYNNILQQNTTLHHDDSFASPQQKPSQLFHANDGLVPLASHTNTISQPAPNQGPKISVRSEQDLGLSRQYSSAPVSSDPRLVDHQYVAPSCMPYRPPIIYNQIFLNQENSTDIIPTPVNQKNPQALPQYTFNTSQSNSIYSQMYNQNNPYNPESQQYAPQNSIILPPMQQYFKNQHEQLIQYQIQGNNSIARQSTTKQTKNNGDLRKVRLTNEKSNTVSSNPSIDTRYNDYPNQTLPTFSSALPWNKVGTNVVDARKDSGVQNHLNEPSALVKLLNHISANIPSENQWHYNQQNQLNTQRSYQSQQQLSHGFNWYPQSSSTSTATALPNSAAKHQPKPTIRPPLPSYENGSRHHKIPVNAVKPTEQQMQRANQPNGQMENSRAASTDSGIMSPLTSPTPPVIDMNKSTAMDNLVPVITHVTSLHPQATYHVTNECYVCKTVTRKKCLGCLQIYYCSVNCQKVHWDVHGPECGT